MSSSELCSVDLVGLVLLSSTPLSLTQFLPSLLQGFLSSEGRDLMEIPLRAVCSKDSLSLCIGCGSLNSFPSAAGGSLSDAA